MEISSINNIPEVCAKELRKLNIESVVPFKCSFEDGKQELICNKILRVIPGKRLVLLARWNQKIIVAKIFFKPSRARKEIIAVEGMQHLKIPIPNLLCQCENAKDKFNILIYEYLGDALTAEEMLLPYNTSTEWQETMQALMLEIATQHVLGLMQHDLHLKNFLIHPENLKIFTLDFADIEIKEGPLNKKLSLDNLALLFIQLGAVSFQLYENLFKFYAASRGWLIQRKDYRYLQKQIREFQQNRKLAFQKKIFRNCTDFASIKCKNMKMVYDRKFAIQEFLPIENLFNGQTQHPIKMIKEGNSATIIETEIHGKKYIIKRYNIKNLSHRIKRLFRKTRAANAWCFANYLCLVGIATAKPVAFINVTKLGWQKASYFITEKIEGAQLIEQNADQLIMIAGKVRFMLDNLYQLGMTHGDLKATNILVNQNQPYLLDLDGMRFHRFKFFLNKAFDKDKKRFLKNWMHLDVYNGIEKLWT